MVPFKSHHRFFMCLLALSSSFSPLVSQELKSPTSDVESRKLNVSMSGFPDISFLKNKIEFAHFVNEKDSALVVVKMEETPIVNGERIIIITYSGRKALNGINDELSYMPPVGETEEDTKLNVVKILKITLIKYAAHTPVGDDISINYSHTEEQVAAVKDKWNYWLFSFNFHFNLNGEKSVRGNNLSGGFSARRITDEWIIRANVNTNYSENIFDMKEIGLSYINITRNHNFNGLFVKSLGNHWSVGAFTEASQATYYNNKFSSEIAPAIEYNIFPYIESEKRAFTFLYRLGYIYRNYWEETIYGKRNEGLFQTSLMADVEIYKPWGSIESSLTGSAYLKDFTKNKLT